MRKTSLLTSLLTVVIIGFWLRLRAAELQNFGLDEALIFMTAKLPFKHLFFADHYDKARPQFFYLFLHHWQKIDTSPLFLRLPTVGSSIPSIILVFLIGSLVKNPTAGILAAFIFACHPLYVDLGFQQKSYGFETFFLLGAVYSLLKLLKTRKNSWKFLAIFFNSLAFYTDYSSVWYFLSLLFSSLVGLFLWGKKFNKKFKIIFNTLIISSFFMAFQMPIFLKGLSSSLEVQSYVGRVDFESIKTALVIFSGLAYKNRLNYFLLLICLANVCLFYQRSKKDLSRFFALLIFNCFFLTLFLSYTISQVSPIFVPRNMLVAGFFFIFGIAFLSDLIIKNKPLFLIFFSFYFLGLGKTSFERYRFKGGYDWPRIRGWISKIKEEKILIYIGFYPHIMYPLHYYLLGYGHHTPVRDYKIIHLRTYEDLEKVRNYKDVPSVLIFITGKKGNYRELIEATQEALNCEEKLCKEVIQV